MKKLITILTLVVMLFSMTTIIASAETVTTGKVIFVSPSGNDANDGSEASPLATLKGARDKVRAIKASGMPANGITVMFRGGEYKWTETVTFDSQDSGTENAKIRYMAYPGETPVFTGGARIPASEFSPVTDESVLAKWSNRKAKEAIRQFDIKSYVAKMGRTDMAAWYPLMEDRYAVGTADELYKARPMFSTDDNPVLWLARYPNKKEGNYPENMFPSYILTGNVIKETKDEGNVKNQEGSVFQYSDRRISKYSGYEDVWFYGLPKWVFYDEELKIKSIDASNSTITTAVAPRIGISSGREFCIYNILDELDQAGEYYVDKNSGILYFYPQGEFEYFNVSLFSGTEMIRVKDASHIIFSGLTLENSRSDGIYITGGDSVRVEYCDVKNLSGNGITIGDASEVVYTPFIDYKWTDWNDNYALTEAQTAVKVIEDWTKPSKSVKVRGQNHGVYGCSITNIGLTGVSLAGGNLYLEERANYYVENCDISFAGQNCTRYQPGIEFSNIHGVSIKNNELSHFPGSAIQGYVTGAEITGNNIYDGVTNNYDMGLLYLNYCMPALDVTIKNNYLHDVPPEVEITSPSSPLSQRSAIAFDFDGPMDVDITNNVIENIPRVIFLNDMEVISNNVIIDCYEPAYTVNQTTHNYPAQNKENVFNAKEAFHSGYWTYVPCWPVFAEGEYGVKYRKIWEENYPRVMDWIDITQSQVHKGRNFLQVDNNLAVNKRGYLLGSHLKFNDLQFADVEFSSAKNNTYTSDTSMFVDYENQNYQLTDAAKAKYGIDIDMSAIGTKTDATGTDLYKTTYTSVPSSTGGVSTPAPSTATVPEKVKDAVVLKIGSPNAFATGKAAKVDSNNAAVKPQIINSRTLVPARFIAESFGGEVGWDNDTRTVTIKLNGKTITMVLDKNELMIDGEVATVMDVPAQSIEGRTMVPLRVLCETALSKTVFWDPMGLIVISDGELMNAETDAALIKEIYDSL